ncbi:MAG: hypothetical protein H6550_16220 [Chitinophagales bacterium]|nr:hypothetical protein [Chitinophagales bacterium]
MTQVKPYINNFKFRGISIATGDWIYGWPISTPEFPDKWCIMYKNDPIQVIPDTISDYTDMTDDEGDDLYIGDKVRCGKDDWPAELVFTIWRGIDGGLILRAGDESAMDINTPDTMVLCGNIHTDKN